jgi:hypothetical protein
MTRARARHVDHEDFAAAVEELVGEMSAAEILAIPGAWEVLSDALNNEAIARASEKAEAAAE